LKKTGSVLKFLDTALSFLLPLQIARKIFTQPSFVYSLICPFICNFSVYVLCTVSLRNKDYYYSNIMATSFSVQAYRQYAWVRARLCKLQKGCIRLAAASDKSYQLLAHDLWFSPGTPASSATKTGRYDIAEILLKVALITKNQFNHSVLPYW
jgi:hypothetical protein